MEGLLKKGLGTADTESRYMTKGKKAKPKTNCGYRGSNITRNVKVVNLEMRPIRRRRTAE